MPVQTVVFPTMNHKYKKTDLPMPAVFYARKLKHARVRIESVQEKVGAGGVMERKPGTGFDVLFRVHRAIITNSTILKLMMEHEMFRHTSGWDIDPEDPTGLWRALGYVKEVEVVETHLNLESGTKPVPPDLAGIKNCVKVWNEAQKEEVVDGGDSTDSSGADGATGFDEQGAEE